MSEFQTNCKSVWIIIYSSLMVEPFLLDPPLNTIEVKDMLASKLNNSFFSKTLNVAYYTKRICIISMSFLFIFSYTVLMKARRMLSLMTVTVARMPALKKLSTTSPCLLLALSLCAYTIVVIISIILDWSLAKSTFLHIFLLFIHGACLTDMIWLCLTTHTKIVPAFIASNTILTHMFSCSLIDILSFIIFIIIVNLSLHEFNSITAFAANHSIILINELESELGLDIF